MLPHEIGLFVRLDAEVSRSRAAAEAAKVPYKVLDERVETASGHVSLGTMHLAKGLECRAVAVMAGDDEVIPLQSRIETVAEDSDLEEVYHTACHLLYVACTRAREHLLVTSVAPGSEFLEDLRSARILQGSIPVGYRFQAEETGQHGVVAESREAYPFGCECEKFMRYTASANI